MFFLYVVTFLVSCFMFLPGDSDQTPACSICLKFELRVISQGHFLSDKYRTTVEKKQTDAIEYSSLQCTSSVQFLVVNEFSNE